MSKIDQDDIRYLRRAIELSRQARAKGNGAYGAILVHADGRVLAEAENNQVTGRDGTGHAEMNLVRVASERFDAATLAGATLYASAEPCAMCAAAISHARIARVVYGASDPKSGGVEQGARVWDQAQTHWKPKVTAGVEAEAAATLLRDFFKARR